MYQGEEQAKCVSSPVPVCKMWFRSRVGGGSEARVVWLSMSAGHSPARSMQWPHHSFLLPACVTVKRQQYYRTGQVCVCMGGSLVV